MKDQVRLLERELQEFRLRENKLKDELSILSEQKQSATIEKERNQLESERIKSEYLATNKRWKHVHLVQRQMFNLKCNSKGSKALAINKNVL